MLKLFTFCLHSCIVNKGEKFAHVLGTWNHLEGVPIGTGKFCAVWCRASHMARSNGPPDGQLCGRRSNRLVQAV
jgi:hypothetical protein